eukprot:5718544-Karenia_brevis.AAC.1
MLPTLNQFGSKMNGFQKFFGRKRSVQRLSEGPLAPKGPEGPLGPDSAKRCPLTARSAVR